MNNYYIIEQSDLQSTFRLGEYFNLNNIREAMGVADNEQIFQETVMVIKLEGELQAYKDKEGRWHIVDGPVEC